MMEIEAVSIAAPVFRLSQAGPVQGTVTGVYDHAVNLESGARLLSLVTQSGGNLPYAVCCRFGDLPLQNTFTPGSAFAWSGGRIHFWQDGLAVQLAGARQWQPPRPVLHSSAMARRGAARLQTWLAGLRTAPAELPHIRSLAAGLRQTPYGGGEQAEPWVARFNDRVRRLGQAAAAGNWPAVESAAFGLLGLGIGLTPSGDDFLAGFLTAGLALGPRAAFQHLARSVARRAPERTTQVSAALFQALSQDQLTERCGALLAAIDENTRHLEAAAQRMLAYGASSGLETMYGLLYGLQAAGAAGTF